MPTLFEKYNVSQQQLLVSGVLIAYIIYLSVVTTPVANFDAETEILLYGLTAFAPPTYVTNNQMLLGIALVIILVLSFRGKQFSQIRVSERQFKEHLTKILKFKQKSYPSPASSPHSLHSLT